MTDPLVINDDIELPQQDLSKIYTTDCTIEYSTGNFTCLAVVFELRRRLGYHLFHTYIPSALIVVMSWISFWIKPEAIPARITLGVTSLLTLGGFHWFIMYIDCLHYDTEGIHKPFYSLLISFQSHSKYTITTIAATCFVCESRRYLDVIVFGVCVYVVDGICGGQ